MQQNQNKYTITDTDMSIESTLHGYRVQFLYTLYRMLVSNNLQEVFVPFQATEVRQNN